MKTVFFIIITYVTAIGALSLFTGCGAALPAGLAGVTLSSCLSPESAQALDDDLKADLAEELRAFERGEISEAEYTSRVRDDLLKYGVSLKESVVADTLAAVVDAMQSAQSTATQQGGAIGLLSSLGVWYMRERSWKNKRSHEAPTPIEPQTSK